MKAWEVMLFSSVKRLKRANMHFMYCEKVEETFWFCDIFFLKDSFKYGKKGAYKWVRGQTSGRSLHE